jgi:hypothetical protein
MDRGNVSRIAPWLAMLASATNVARAQDAAPGATQSAPPTKSFPALPSEERPHASPAPGPAASTPPEMTSADRPNQHAGPPALPVPNRATAARESLGDETTATRWYGWQTLAADGAAIGLLATTWSVGDGTLAEAGAVLTYWLGAPFVHVAHERPLTALASTGLRAGAPLTGALVAYALLDCSGQDFCGLGAIAVGAPIGAGVAIVVDGAVLAREDVRSVPGRHPRSARRLRSLPSVAVTHEWRGIVLTGDF